MYTDFYERISRWWRQQPNGAAWLGTADSALRILVAVSYAALLAWLAVSGGVARLVRAILVPAATFAAVTALRAAIDADRPYEANPIRPLIFKETHGKSTPSRHMASAVVIACTFWWAVGAVAGVLWLLVCCAIGYVRVVGGVHFPRDIVSAAFLATTCALVGFVLIP